MATLTALPDTPQSGSADGLPLAARQWNPRSLRGITGWACRWTDLCILSAVFLGTIVFHFLHQTEHTAAEFFAVRISMANLFLASTLVVLWRAILRTLGVYDLARITSLKSYVARWFGAVTCCAVIVAIVERSFRPGTATGALDLSFWGASLACMTASRGLLLYFDRSIRPHLREKRNLLIVGTGSRAVDVYEEMKTNRDLDYNLIGYLDSDPQSGFVAAEQVIGRTEELESILMHQEIDEVVVALPMKSQYQTIADTIATCERVGIRSQYFTHHFGGTVTKKRHATGRKSGRMVLEAVHSDGRRYLKRLVDFTGALFGLIALSPLLLATAIAVKLTSPGPIVFKQQRFGYNKRKFFIYKFRSMVIDAEARQKEIEHLNELSGPTFKITKDPRVTPIGSFLRKTSIDELPQLFNILKGDMSLVGPRPLNLRDVGLFSEAWLMRRFSVKPGLTCIWQVSGRSNIDFDRWIELDLEYIDNWSLALDFELLFKTVPSVLASRGAS